MRLTKRNITVIDVAKMRDVIMLMEPTIVNDGRGGQERTYTETEVFCFFIPGKNLRQLQEEGLTFDKMGTFYMRFNSSIVETWKVKYKGLEYTIHGVEDVDAVQRFTQIVAYTKQ
jgi:SPP1 family predicted phage head-tail adaptor